MIIFKNVTKVYSHGITALRDVTLKISNGEFVFLVGPTGAGKSTFLKLLYRAEIPTTGKLRVNDMDLTSMRKAKIPTLRRMIGIVFQDFKLLKDRSVFENLAFALRAVGVTSRLQIQEDIEDALKKVRLLRKKNIYVYRLSGGEQQRVAIARALINRPKILIADEPTGNLDPNTSLSIMDILQDLNLRGTTIIMASHDKMIVDKMKRRVVRMDAGSIVEDVDMGVY